MGFRLAIPADAEALVALIRSAYRGDTSRAGWTTEADLVSGDRIDAGQVLAMIGGPRSVLIVLDGEDGLTACCQLEDRGGGVTYFGTFAVSPAGQGGGTGRRLMAEAERQALTRYGATILEMTVLAQQVKLIGWYERLGFRRTGETRPFPADGTYARPLRDDLYFVVLAKPLNAGEAPAAS
jgi:ribosomal protein S18 acetylase RimI-like enzyme